nr:biotin-dependent carboxyltransferase family protein [Stagnihabitans tardus]
MKVLFAGPHVTLQDQGRPGHLRFGVPASGPMDRLAFRLAQGAIGAEGAAIEVSLGGLALQNLDEDVTLAIAGGGFIAEHRGKGTSWQVLTLRRGETLRLRPGFWGAWTYVAVAGRIQASTWLGAQATHGPSGLGGGRLTTGQILTIETPRTLPETAIPCPVTARPRSILRATPGPQDRFFSRTSLTAIFSESFTLSPAIDRMGLRLTGPHLPPEGALSIPSEPLLRGSVQVNGAGVASILMADHQTTGGYPKIATVIDADLDAAARLRPGDRLRFAPVTPEQALGIERLQRILPKTGRD